MEGDAHGTKAVEKGEFPFAAAFLEHGHIYGQCQGLIEAGAQLKWVYDPDAKKVEAFLRKFPDAKPARCYEEILEDSSVRLVAAAAVPSERCALGHPRPWRRARTISPIKARSPRWSSWRRQGRRAAHGAQIRCILWGTPALGMLGVGWANGQKAERLAG